MVNFASGISGPGGFVDVEGIGGTTGRLLLAASVVLLVVELEVPDLDSLSLSQFDTSARKATTPATAQRAFPREGFCFSGAPAAVSGGGGGGGVSGGGGGGDED